MENSCYYSNVLNLMFSLQRGNKVLKVHQHEVTTSFDEYFYRRRLLSALHTASVRGNTHTYIHTRARAHTHALTLIQEIGCVSRLSRRWEADRGTGPQVSGGGRMGDETRRVSPLKNFVAGGVAGTCLLLAGHPLDTIKVTD